MLSKSVALEGPARLSKGNGNGSSRKNELKAKPDEVAVPTVNQRVTGKRQEKKQPEYPPITPIAALGYALIISRVSSSDADKRKISHKAMNELVDLDKTYRKDERARSFIQAVRTLVMTSAITIGESNTSLNRKLESASQCTKANIKHFKEMKDMRSKYLEQSKKVKTLPSITAWFASLGISVGAVAALKTEVMNFVATHFPQLQDLETAAYLAGASLVAGAVLGVRSLMNKVLNRKMENNVKDFQGKKKGEEEAFAGKRDGFVEAHVRKVIDVAASVFAETIRLCEAYYPEYLAVMPRYKEYLETRQSKGDKQAKEFILGVGKSEAQTRLKNRFFHENGRSLATLLTNNSPA